MISDTSMTLGASWALISIIVALLALFFRPHPPSLILHPRVALLLQINPGNRARMRRFILSLIGGAFLFLLALAASRPQQISVLEQEQEARNIMLALDLSTSMATADFVNGSSLSPRIDGVKTVVRDFIATRSGDRIGLVVFGAGAYVQAPLTRDTELLRSMVDRLQLGIAGDGTAIGEGLGVSLKRIAEVPAKTKAIILVTDGVNNAGMVNPLKAAHVAKDLGVKIHTIGIGSTDASRLDPMAFLQGRAEFDEKMLKEIARITDGVYFNADNLEGLQKVYQEIDALERTIDDAPPQQIVEELYVPLAWGALGCLILYAILSSTLFLKVTRS